MSKFIGTAPPAEFVAAVMSSPLPGTREYVTAVAPFVARRRASSVKDPVSVTLERHVELVLFEFLSRLSDADEFRAEDRAGTGCYLDAGGEPGIDPCRAVRSKISGVADSVQKTGCKIRKGRTRARCVAAEPTDEADRGRHPGFARHEGLAGGPGSLSLSFGGLVPTGFLFSRHRVSRQRRSIWECGSYLQRRSPSDWLFDGSTSYWSVQTYRGIQGDSPATSSQRKGVGPSSSRRSSRLGKQCCWRRWQANNRRSIRHQS